MNNAAFKNVSAVTLGTALSYWAVSSLNFALFKSGGLLPMPLWPAAGIAIALSYRFGGRAIPGLYIGSLLANAITLGSSWELAALFGVTNALGPWLAVRLIQRMTQRRNPLESINDFVVFVLLAVLVHPMITATGGIGSQLLLGNIQAAAFLTKWQSWWLGHAVGTILFAPILLIAFLPFQDSARQRNREFALIALATILGTILLFWFMNAFASGWPYMLIVPMAWVAIRHSMFRTLLLFTAVVLIGMSGIVLNPAHRAGDLAAMVPFRIMTVAYSIVLLLFSIMRRMQEQTEKDVRESQTTLASVMDTIPQSVFWKSREGAYLGCNMTFARAVGLDAPSRVIGRTDFDMPWPRKEAEAYRADDREVLEQNRPKLHIIEPLQQADGSRLWIDTTKIPLMNAEGTPYAVLGVYEDITERKRAEEALRTSEQKYRLLFENMTAGFALHEMIYDPEGRPLDYRYIELNPAFERLTGAKATDLIGHTVKEVMPQTEQHWIDTFGKVAQTGEPVAYENYAREIGRYFNVWAFSPAPDRFAVVFHDITDRKRAEELVASKNKELEQIVYVASHDLRSPLVNVDGYGRELEDSLNGIAAVLDEPAGPAKELEPRLRAEIPEMVSALRFIRGSTRQMDTLIKGLLKLSRSGRVELAVKPLDMNQLLQRVAASFEYLVKSTGAELRIDPLPPCNGDDAQLVQVFSNLIGNALKYLDPARPGIVSVRGTVEFDRAVYCVEDNGIGIAPEHQDKIFELFYRLDPAKSEGEGLGLTIVRQIVNRLDGTICVESSAGKGCRFCVTLPCAKTKDVS